MCIDCDLLTGFLGSGKTTLLNAWLRSPQSFGTAVVVNEIGDIGIDHLVLSQVSDNVVLLESGCLCCTLSGELRETLLNLCATACANHMPLTRIVVETTGLAEPLPILHALLGDKILTETIRLNQVIVTVDGQQGLAQLADQPESVRQLATAECVVITKGDLASPQTVQDLMRAIDRINPGATVIESTDGDAAVQVFTAAAGVAQRQALLAAVHADSRAASAHARHAHDCGHSHSHSQPHEPHGVFHARVSTLGFYVEESVTWPGISAWWRLVSNRYADRLLRGKGLLHMQDPARPYVFMQTVGKVFHPPGTVAEWPDTDRRSRLVCIGVDLDATWLQQSLAVLHIDEPDRFVETPGDLARVAAPDARPV